MSSVPEKDWKRLKKLKDEKLNKACSNILQKIESEIKGEEKNSHEVYLKVWKLIEREDKKIAEMFDDLRRSNALYKLASWKIYGLLNDEELSGFSEETRSTIEKIESLRR